MHNTRRTRRNAKRTRRSRGGVAPFPSGMTVSAYQPSEKVMDWATTAGAATPSAAEMRNVAHGGKRSNRRSHKRHHKHRHSRRR